MCYPLWLRDLFALFTALYGNLWVNQFINDDMSTTIKHAWWSTLRDFEENEIRDIFEQIGKKFVYAPKPLQILELLILNRNRKKDEEAFRTFDEKRLLPMQPKNPDSMTTLEAKALMFEKLGLVIKAQKLMDEISLRNTNEP